MIIRTTLSEPYSMKSVVEWKLPPSTKLQGTPQDEIDRIVALIRRTGGHRIGLIGITPENEAGDLKSNPLLHVMASLLDEGYEVRFFDPSILPGVAGRPHSLHMCTAKRGDIGNMICQLPWLKCDSATKLSAWCDTLATINDSNHVRLIFESHEGVEGKIHRHGSLPAH